MPGAGLSASGSRMSGEVAKVKDPVCGMEVDPKSAAEKIEYEGRT